MIIASQKRKENIAEYIIYMWQIEDLIRANDFDMERIRENVINRFDLNDDQRREMTEWYESLIEMMEREGVKEQGHLQINKNILADMVRLHQALLADPRFADYTAEFYRTLPFIVELRSKSGEEKRGEIETCFNALYGMLLMRLRQKEISPETKAAIRQITRFIATLARNYHLDEKGELFDKDSNDKGSESV